MPKLRTLSGSEVVKIFTSFGFQIAHQKGSHVKLLLSALLITALTCILSLNSYAHEEKKERGKNGRITKVELFYKLNKLKGDEYVDGYIIKGSDIIAIIKESDIDIKIRLSIIEGGLDFSKLPEVNGKREVNN